MKYVLLSVASVVLVVVSLVGITLYQSRTYSQQEDNSIAPQNTTSPTVIYDGTAFTPATLTISAGTTVTFDNTSERPMWVASDVHPTHELYPEFDTAAANGSPPDAEDDGVFTFQKSGTWSYHDHNNPSATATITVN